MHLRSALVLSTCVAIAATLATVPAQATESATVVAANPEPVPAVSREEAARTLDEAQETLAGKGSRDMTLVLRDLRAAREQLSGADRVQADRLLQRPAANRNRDFERVRVHWNAGVATSAYVDQVGEVADSVLATYEAAGYRPPKPDGKSGGNALLDIYLRDLGQESLYGWCDSDDPPTGNGPYDASAYCAFDNDYAEFQNPDPLENLQVTAAHELFHAVQFAYDYYEDGWFMEATATWVEDELFDDVNDSVQYLTTSPLKQPQKSMDRFGGLHEYGGWIFFRYLTETYPKAKGGLPTLVRDMWARADGAQGRPDDYSIQAVAHVLAKRGPGLTAMWAKFAAANRRPAASYSEGASYPKAKPTATIALSGGKRSSGLVTRSINHLASKTIRFNRAPRMKASTLKLELDLPRSKRGSGAVATVYRTTGRPTMVPISLSSAGDAATRLDFGRDVTRVEVTLANAGISYRCWRPSDTGFSCNGRPQDDNLSFKIRATAAR